MNDTFLNSTSPFKFGRLNGFSVFPPSLRLDISSFIDLYAVRAEFTLVRALASCDKGAKVLPHKITTAIKAPIVTIPSCIRNTP